MDWQLGHNFQRLASACGLHAASVMVMLRCKGTSSTGLTCTTAFSTQGRADFTA